MLLKYPLLKDKVGWFKKQFDKIPADGINHSGYYLVAVAEDTFDLYIAFTDESRKQVWIEKTNKLARDPIRTTNFVEIKDNEEFNKAHGFFVEQGLL